MKISIINVIQKLIFILLFPYIVKLWMSYCSLCILMLTIINVIQFRMSFCKLILSIVLRWLMIVVKWVILVLIFLEAKWRFAAGSPASKSFTLKVYKRLDANLPTSKGVFRCVQTRFRAFFFNEATYLDAGHVRFRA